MKNHFCISIFPINSKKGKDLALNIKNIILLKFMGEEYIESKYLSNYDSKNKFSTRLTITIYDKSVKEVKQSDFSFACLNDDIVIVDVTREGDYNEINNYDIVNEFPKNMDHIWVVSRNYLPINFYGIRNGGYPTYKEGVKSNNDICSWIKTQLSTTKLSIPRDIEEKGVEGFHITSKKSSEKFYLQKNKNVNIFISFRTKYAQKSETLTEKGYKYSVNELATRIKRGIYHNGVSKNAVYLDDGNLIFSSELTTKQRAWQLLSIIDRDYIMHCDELWIYGTDDYLNSWWTVGELFIYSYLLHQNIDKRPNKTPRKLILYNPKTDKIKEIKPFDINDDSLFLKMSRIQSNCSPSMMGFESIIINRLMRDILYGDCEKHKIALKKYTDFQLQLLPYLLKDQGLDENTINQIILMPDFYSKMYCSIEKQLMDLKEQISTGNISNEMRAFYGQIFNIHNMYLNDDIRTKITEDELIITGLSESYLNDYFFSEDFWENIVLLNNCDSFEHESLEYKLNHLDEQLFLDHMTFNYPIKYQTLGKIENLNSDSKINGRSVEKKPSRFFFMPSRGGYIDFSPTHNNLYELPIYILK